MIRPTITVLSGAGLLLLAGLGHANLINAVSGSFADVSSAVASASPGDTVVIPAGQNTWTQTLNLSGITLQGAGTNLTVIVDETPITGYGAPIFNVTTAPTMTRITQLTITVGVTNTYPTVSMQAGNASAGVRGNINIFGNYPFRIDHCVFHYLTGKPVNITGQANGLIDHCVFEMFAGANAIEVDGGVGSDNGWGDYSWSTPYVFGSSNAMFIEDNYISSVFKFTAIDSDNGARVVIRHNFFQSSFVYTHGTESGQRTRSVRALEAYNNIFNYSTVFDNCSQAIAIRGGTAVIFNNCATNFYSLAALQDYRSTDNSPAFTPWFGATGLSGYDSNSPALLSGVASATSTTLVISNANWAVNQFYGCTVYNSNNNLSGIVTTNNANTMWFLTSASPWYQIHFAAGDTFVVHLVYPQLDQPGRGYGTLLTGATPNPIWANQTLEPIYFWSNSLDYNFQPTASGGLGYSLYPNIANGRDFTNAVKAGYSPFIYPHPLNVDTSSSTNNTAAIKPPPPSSLSTHTPGH